MNAMIATIIAISQNTTIGQDCFVQISLVKCVGKKDTINAIAIITNEGKIYCPLTYGTLNLLSGLSFLPCKTSTPPHTNTNANKVPMLVSDNTWLRFKN